MLSPIPYGEVSDVKNSNEVGVLTLNVPDSQSNPKLLEEELIFPKLSEDSLEVDVLSLKFSELELSLKFSELVLSELPKEELELSEKFSEELELSEKFSEELELSEKFSELELSEKFSDELELSEKFSDDELSLKLSDELEELLSLGQS